MPTLKIRADACDGMSSDLYCSLFEEDVEQVAIKVDVERLQKPYFVTDNASKEAGVNLMFKLPVQGEFLDSQGMSTTPNYHRMQDLQVEFNPNIAGAYEAKFISESRHDHEDYWHSPNVAVDLHRIMREGLKNTVTTDNDYIGHALYEVLSEQIENGEESNQVIFNLVEDDMYSIFLTLESHEYDDYLSDAQKRQLDDERKAHSEQIDNGLAPR